jgi:hypothetical protein
MLAAEGAERSPDNWASSVLVARGGYAFFDSSFPPSARRLLALAAERESVCRAHRDAILSNQFPESGGLTMAETNPNYATPSAIRSVTSYPARRGFK